MKFTKFIAAAFIMLATICGTAQAQNFTEADAKKYGLPLSEFKARMEHYKYLTGSYADKVAPASKRGAKCIETCMKADNIGMCEMIIERAECDLPHRYERGPNPLSKK